MVYANIDNLMTEDIAMVSAENDNILESACRVLMKLNGTAGSIHGGIQALEELLQSCGYENTEIPADTILSDSRFTDGYIRSRARMLNMR